MSEGLSHLLACDMTTKHKHDNPILVTGGAGAVGSIGRNLTEFLPAALVPRTDARASPNIISLRR